MKEFKYVVTDPEGIHARPAGMLVKGVKEFSCDIKIAKDGKAMNCKAIFGIMGLAVKQGEEVTLTFDGADEDAAYEAISNFIDKQDTIYAHRSNELFRNRKTVAVKENTPSTRKATTAVAGKGKLSYYTIKSGDTLSTIAGKYGVSVKDIQRWNGMSNTKIAAGKRLKIYK